MSRPENKILVIDDDAELTQSIASFLEQSGYTVIQVTTPSLAMETIQQETPDVIILDIIMPEISGTEICRMIRQLPVYYPIIMLTSKSDIVDKVVGLEIGADDYMPKPFSLRELEARVNATLRRKTLEKSSQSEGRLGSVIQHGDIAMDIKNRVVRIGQRKVDLTPKEFELMKLFLSQPGKAFSRDELLSKIWGEDYKGFHRTVDSHINRLRLKVETNPDQPQIITTVWGVGYKCNEDYNPDTI